jgi:hypothetical protein
VGEWEEERQRMRVIQIDGELDEDVEELLRVSGRVRTKEELMRKAVLDAIDPMIAGGPEFEFEDRPRDERWISLEVPDSSAKVDLAVAWRVAQLDARACALVLERDHSLQATLRVYKNSLDWLRFWSWRHPNDRWRSVFERQLRDRRAGLEALRSEAGLRFRFDLLEELKAI